MLIRYLPGLPPSPHRAVVSTLPPKKFQSKATRAGRKRREERETKRKRKHRLFFRADRGGARTPRSIGFFLFCLAAILELHLLFFNPLLPSGLSKLLLQPAFSFWPFLFIFSFSILWYESSSPDTTTTPTTRARLGMTSSYLHKREGDRGKRTVARRSRTSRRLCQVLHAAYRIASHRTNASLVNTSL
ncbi:hypothetical protein FA10DRAFT_34210 [Acaromyces ingoldii]|uniref:Uncharacterized protein n=1 Tax=Acaromyces ingoldii TaxID=215250 RepID=A0A316YWI6_9BASI|nr:hypothetical protein FA10DRAFT_34210 [Acaromyces ingoldii]PWN93890.1 hypothetical protein FA10DRAFT_34210 [Acaromyces ingoldii]